MIFYPFDSCAFTITEFHWWNHLMKWTEFYLLDLFTTGFWWFLWLACTLKLVFLLHSIRTGVKGHEKPTACKLNKLKTIPIVFRVWLYKAKCFRKLLSIIYQANHYLYICAYYFYRRLNRQKIKHWVNVGFNAVWNRVQRQF